MSAVAKLLYLLTSNHSDRSIASEFFTGDQFLLLCSSASRLSEPSVEGDELLLHGAAVISEARRRRDENRFTIARPRRPRETLSENIGKLRSAHEAVAAKTPSARSFMHCASAKLDERSSISVADRS